MNNRRSKISLLPLLIISFSLACGSLQTQTPTERTHSLARRSSSPTHVAAAARPDSADLSVMQSHIHPSGMFSYDAPLDWSIQNTDSGVVVYSPNDVVFSLSLIHTGYRLSGRSFVELAANAENTHYGNKDQYEEVYRREDGSNRFALIEKVHIVDGKKQQISTIYRQIDHSVYILEMTGDRTLVTADSNYAKLFLAFNESIEDQQSIYAAPAYRDSWTFNDTHDLFSIDVPLGWKTITDESADGLVRTQFRSPDDNGIVESIIWEPGGRVALGSAADFLLDILKASYAADANDIKITSEIVLEDWKSERITWISHSGGYAGVAYFEVQNQTEVVILSIVWNRLFDDIYEPILNSAASSFAPNLPVE